MKYFGKFWKVRGPIIWYCTPALKTLVAALVRTTLGATAGQNGLNLRTTAGASRRGVLIATTTTLYSAEGCGVGGYTGCPRII